MGLSFFHKMFAHNGKLPVHVRVFAVEAEEDEGEVQGPRRRGERTEDAATGRE